MGLRSQRLVVNRLGQQLFHLHPPSYQVCRFHLSIVCTCNLIVMIQGASSSVVHATAPTSFAVPSATNSVSSSVDSSSSKHLVEILPATIVPAVLVLVAAIWLFSRYRRNVILPHDSQVASSGNAGGTSTAFFPNAQHIIAPNSTFQYIGGSQYNRQLHQ